jgi:hypothetical protein
MDILNAYVATASQVDTLWNVFMGVHIGIFGLLFKYRKKLQIIHKVAILVGYAVFAFMNMRALLIKYSLLEKLRPDIIHWAEKQEFSGLKTYLNENPLGHRFSNVVAIHAVVAGCFAYYCIDDGSSGKFKEFCVTHLDALGNSIKEWTLQLYRKCVAGVGWFNLKMRSKFHIIKDYIAKIMS